MNWPESNEKLKKLRRKWEADGFGLDTVGVYPIWEAVKEAEEHLSMYSRSSEDLYGWKSNDDISRELARQQEKDRYYADASDNYMDRKYGHKTCRICNKKTRNDPCDTCYRMVRDAAEWTETSSTIEIYPCTICDDEVRTTICGSCMDAMLGE